MVEEQLVVNSSVAEISREVLAHLYAAGAITLPKAKRQRIDWERVLVYEYVKANYGEKPHWFREAVGPLPPGQEGNFYARTRRWADAIIRDTDKMIIIEGKMKCEPAVIGQLINYRNLLPQTPMLRKYNDLPVEMRVITAMITDEVHSLLESAGINVEIFKPSNFEQWHNQVILKQKPEVK